MPAPIAPEVIYRLTSVADPSISPDGGRESIRAVEGGQGSHGDPLSGHDDRTA